MVREMTHSQTSPIEIGGFKKKMEENKGQLTIGDFSC